MKRALLLLLVFCGISTLQAQEQITFLKGKYEKTLKKATKDPKPIMLFFSLDESSSCETFEQSFFHNQEIARFYNQNFHCKKIDSKDKDRNSLLKKYNINIFPSIVFINANEELIHKSIGQIKPENGISLGKDVVNGINTLKFYREAYSKKVERDPFLTLEYANALYKAQEPYTEVINTFFKLIPDEQMYDEIVINAIIKYSTDMNSREFIFFAQNFNKLESQEYSFSDRLFKLEDVISNNLISSIRKNSSIELEDALIQIQNSLHLSYEELVHSRVNFDYYKSINNKDSAMYFTAMRQYLELHVKYLPAKNISGYCLETESASEAYYHYVLSSIRILDEATAAQGASIDLMYAKAKLLYKLGDISDAKDIFKKIEENFANEIDLEWHLKLESFRAELEKA